MLRLAKKKGLVKEMRIFFVFYYKYYYDYLNYFQTNVIYFFSINICLSYLKIQLFNKLQAYSVNFISEMKSSLN